MKLRCSYLLLLFAALISASAAAEDQVKVEVVLTGLTNPCGVAVQPNTGAVFVSDTGAGQIVKFSAAAPNKSTPVIVGFPQAADTSNKEPTYGVGPLGLAFLAPNTLVTGEGALKPGDEVVRVFDLPADEKPLNFDDARQKLRPKSDPQSKTAGAGNFFALALTPTTLFVTAHGADDAAWVLSANVKSDQIAGDLNPFVQTKALTKVDALLGATFSKHGFLLLGPRDQDAKSSGNKPHHQSLLVFYNAKNGNLLMSLPTGLHDITGLAYSPKSDRLYAVDFAWDDPAQGGLYRLDAATVEGRSGVKAVKMTALDKPSTLAFSPDNVLYVTVFGSIPTDPKTAKPPKPGKLLKITGDL